MTGNIRQADIRRLGWGWLSSARESAGAPTFDSVSMWAGHGGGCTPLHFDSLHNFLAQAAGE